MGIEELLKLFDMLELKKKVVSGEEHQAFTEFCYLLALFLKVDESLVEKYFTQENDTSELLKSSEDEILFCLC